MGEDKAPGQSQSMISPDSLVDLLEASHLKTVGDVYFDDSEVDSWQLRGIESPETGLCRNQEGIQTSQNTVTAASKIAAAAESHIQITESKLMGSGLLSLPVELVQDILHRSFIGESKTGPSARIDLRRVLALQSVSRYFRDVVRSTPEFWTSASSKNIPLLEAQLERSRPLVLNLELVASKLLDSKLHNIITTHSPRWRTLVLHMQDLDFGGPIQEKVSSLTLERLRSLDLHVRRSWGTGPINTVYFDVIPTPELAHLRLFNCQPRNCAASLTEFCFSFDDHAACSGYNLISFIASQRTLKKLVLQVCYLKPNDSEGHVDRLIAQLSPACDRNMFVSLKFDKWPTASLAPLWPAISSFGIATLELDFTNRHFHVLHQSLRGASYYPHDTPGLETLIYSFSSYSSTYRVSLEDDYYEKLEFPSSLQTVLIRNSCREPMDVVFDRLSRLIVRQEALGSAHPVDIVFSGRIPPDDELPAEILPRRVNIPLCEVQYTS